MEKLRLVILGDSITAGCNETGVTAETTYPTLLDHSLKLAGLDVELIVSALHGVYTDYAVRRFDRMVLGHFPDHVLILLGSNDAASTESRSAASPDEYRTGLKSLVELCLEWNIVPIVASPTPRCDVACQYSMTQYVEAARGVAQQFGIEFADLFERFSDAGAHADLLPDGLHPSPAGNKVIADALAELLARHFARRSIPSLHSASASRKREAAAESDGSFDTKSVVRL